MNPEPLNMKDIAIIDAFPTYDYEKTVLNVGCGKARIDFHLASMGFRVYAIDIKSYETWGDMHRLTFHNSDVYDLDGFPVKSAPVVICSQVLEHLKDYRTALANLIKIAEVRLIITIPYEKSFLDPEHINFWSDDYKHIQYRDIREFHKLCKPHCVSISKIRTKPEDVKMKQYGFLIVVDKRQYLNA